MKSRVRDLSPELQRYVPDTPLRGLVCGNVSRSEGPGFSSLCCEKTPFPRVVRLLRVGEKPPSKTRKSFTVRTEVRKVSCQSLPEGHAGIAERQYWIDQSKPKEPERVIPSKLHGELEKFRQAIEENAKK